MRNVVKLRETKRTLKLNINSQKINVNDIALVYDEFMPRQFQRTAIVTGVLSRRDSEIRGATVRMVKANTILKRLVNKLFTVKNPYHDNNQTDQTREQKLRPEAAVIGELKMKYMNVNFVIIGRGQEPLNITNVNILIRFYKAQ